MTDEVEEAKVKELEFAPVADRCPNQDHANARVGVQMERQRDRLNGKRIYTVFSTTLYAFACDRHGAEGVTHVDLASTGIDDLKPDGLAQVIAATEALLAVMKKRVQ